MPAPRNLENHLPLWDFTDMDWNQAGLYRLTSLVNYGQDLLQSDAIRLAETYWTEVGPADPYAKDST